MSADRKGRQSVHMWGFFDAAGGHERAVGVSVTDESPVVAFARVSSNVRFFGGCLESVVSIRPLGGAPKEVHFETPASEDGTADRMWHSIMQADQEPWPAKDLEVADSEAPVPPRRLCESQNDTRIPQETRP